MIFWGIVQLNITRQVYIVVWLLKLKMLFPGFWLHARRDGQLLHSGFPSWILGGLLLSHPLKLEDLRTNTVFIIIVPSPQCTFCFLFSLFRCFSHKSFSPLPLLLHTHRFSRVNLSNNDRGSVFRSLSRGIATCYSNGNAFGLFARCLIHPFR